MVHRHGQAIGRGRHAARARAEGHRRHALGPAARREPHHRHGRDAARLGGLAPARLGRADHGLRAQGDRRGDPAFRLRRLRRVDRAELSRPSRRKAPTPGSSRAPSSASSKAWWTMPTIGSRSTTFSTSGSIPARRMPSCLEQRPDLEMAGRPLSRGLGPASRLVPVLAARGLRHARPRAVRRGADARLRRRRGRPQDVEVARQRDRAAGRDPTSRAPRSCACGP